MKRRAFHRESGKPRYRYQWASAIREFSAAACSLIKFNHVKSTLHVRSNEGTEKMAVEKLKLEKKKKGQTLQMENKQIGCVHYCQRWNTTSTRWGRVLGRWVIYPLSCYWTLVFVIGQTQWIHTAVSLYSEGDRLIGFSTIEFRRVLNSRDVAWSARQWTR